MKILLLLLSVPTLFVACASQQTKTNPLLEKYPFCYHTNVKIVNKCIEKNEAGTKTTATELENTAYPGEFK